MPILLSSSKLLEDDDGIAEPVDNLIRVNHDFAKKFEERKRREELQQLSAKYEKNPSHYQSDSDDESDSSSSSEEEVDLMADLSSDINLVRTIAKIRAKDRSIYDSGSKFFPEDNLEEKEKGVKDDPLTLKKYSHKMLLSGAYLKGDSEDEDPKPKSYNEEQEELRSALIKAASVSEQDEEIELFSTSAAQPSIDDSKYAASFIEAISKATMGAWLNQQPSKKAKKKDAKPIPDVVEDEAAVDAFLASYIMNRGWTHGGAAKKQQHKLENESDSEEIERADEFEVSFNRRFEDDFGGVSNLSQVVGHSRDHSSSIRVEENMRKASRKAKHERHLARERVETEELKRLKVLKRGQIEALAKKVALLSGDSAAAERVASIMKDEANDASSFDEAEHDAKMAALFDDDYYAAEDPLDSELFLESPLKKKKDKKAPEKKKSKSENKKDGNDPEKNVSHENLAESLQKEIASLEEEYYKIHYEDKIAGGLATRFKYKPVVPTTYGLKMEDIVFNEDKALNRYVSLKKLRPYHDEEEQSKDAEKYSRPKVYKRFYFSTAKTSQK